MSTKQTYTSEQVHQAMEMVIKMLGVTAAPSQEQQDLDNNTFQKSSPGMKLTLSVREAAELIGISKPKVYELIRNRVIPSIHIGKKIVVPYQPFMDWLSRGE